MEALIHLHDITHGYPKSPPILHAISLEIPAGQSCALIGASGSGKSTLLNLIGLLDPPSSGTLHLAGQDFTRAGADQRAMARNRLMGFVFQSFNLLPRLDALDNVALPLLYRGLPRDQARHEARQVLAQVGLGHRLCHRPAELSGGQRQRVAIARALVGRPRLLLADEPTGNLDSQTAGEILALLQQLNREQGVTLVMVTHDAGIARCMDRCIEVRQGRLKEARHA